MDNRRQNFGTVVTTEGMWMLGGLFESASDLPTRGISRQFNIPGKFIGHFNPMNNRPISNHQLISTAIFKLRADFNPPAIFNILADFQLTNRFSFFPLGCTKYGHLEDVWVFNPKGWTRDQVLGDAVSKYQGQTDEDVLPTISGYEFSQDTKELSNKKQDFSNFRLYDEATDGPTIQQALDEGWECTGIDGKWCRKPFLNR